MPQPMPLEAPAAADRPDLRAIRLEVSDLAAGYFKKQVLFGVSLQLAPGEIVTVLGHNGAGKTTLLKAICGLVPVRGGRVMFEGKPIVGRSSTANVRAGLSFMPAELATFRDLTVRENLLLGGFSVGDRGLRAARLEEVLELFPLLRERLDQVARTLSGGQQRMLTIGMSLMTDPKVMLLDEPSLGIAPAAVEQILAGVRDLAKRDGRSVLLVEQNVRAALRIADRAYFMRAGQIILEEPGDQALARGQWWDLF